MKGVFLIGCSLLLSVSSQAGLVQKVIYGNDDRVDVAKYRDSAIRELAKSVAGRVNSYRLYGEESDISIDFQKRPLRERMNMCPGERFADQYTLTDCTGFLVGKDILVTAGHCMKDQYDCDQYKWTFDFVDGVESLSGKNLYSCKKIITQATEYNFLGLGFKDYAVIQLDRKVEGRKPLKFRTKGKIKKKARVFVIGHPSGLPKKIADNGTVKHTYWSTFKTNLDTYGGNSGSPVFNRKTLEVEGILVQGAKDYELHGYCYASRSERGKKEKVFKINKIKKLVKMARDGKL